MSEQLLHRVEACYVQAEAFLKRPFSRPEVRLDLRGQKAGIAYLQRNLLRFNLKLYQENSEHFLRQTVAHEVAHLVAHQLFGERIRPHGQEWQRIMRGVYGLTPERCHNYPIERRPRRQFLYLCQCPDQEFAFSAQRHALVLKGRRYLCKRCRATLMDSGRQRLA
ncbi:SprT family zinc-dependent metalloprotease [Stutzerimonas tarimensis]|uniref:SprT family zinc-dependent metalloprotease n=1 Tax=Stutzerimonas tarimensis TaxID=1507735 RepID=A0ABV7T0G9_9GAMM